MWPRGQLCGLVSLPLSDNHYQTYRLVLLGAKGLCPPSHLASLLFGFMKVNELSAGRNQRFLSASQRQARAETLKQCLLTMPCLLL